MNEADQILIHVFRDVMTISKSPFSCLALIHQFSGWIIPIQDLAESGLQSLLGILQNKGHLIKELLLGHRYGPLILRHGLLALSDPHMIAIVNRLDQPCHFHRILIQKNLSVVLRPLPISFDFDQFKICQPGKNLLHGPLAGYGSNSLLTALDRSDHMTAIFKDRIQIIVFTL